MFSVLNINKPYGWSSRDVVNRVQRLVRPAKVGHAGTLDPLATGVLIVAVGQATRLIEYAQRLPKEYRATFLLGQRSETEDLESDVEMLSDVAAPTVEQITSAIAESFIGEIWQRPSRHSAIKVGGRRAYDLARSGADFELPARKVVIHRISVVGYRYPELMLDVQCGSGTYIRALGRDLAQQLGTAAVMASLERFRIGGFYAAQASAADDLLAGIESHLLSPLRLVESLASVAVTDNERRELAHGRAIENRERRIKAPVYPTASGGKEIAAVDDDGNLVAILVERKPSELRPIRNFSQPE